MMKTNMLFVVVAIAVSVVMLISYIFPQIITTNATTIPDHQLRVQDMRPVTTVFSDIDKNDNSLRAALDVSRKFMLARGTKKYEPVPGLSGLTFYVWETDPKPIIMLSNSHMRWYTDVSSESKRIDFMRRLYLNPSSKGTVIDIGINDGFVAALAASYGFPVLAVDAQPECVRRFRIAAAFNLWENIRIHNNIMMDEDKILEIPNGHCTGGSRFQDGVNLQGEMGAKSELSGYTAVKSARLDDLLGGDDVLLFNLDVEGAELSVLRSAHKMLSERRLQNIIFEFAPHRWAKTAEVSRKEVAAVFGGFVCRHLSDGNGVDDIEIEERPPIQDWGKTYDEIWAKKGIIDIWCSAKKKN